MQNRAHDQVTRNAGQSQPNFNFNQPKFAAEVLNFNLAHQNHRSNIEIKSERLFSMQLMLQRLYSVRGFSKSTFWVVGKKLKCFKPSNIIAFITSTLWEFIVNFWLRSKTNRNLYHFRREKLSLYLSFWSRVGELHTLHLL